MGEGEMGEGEKGKGEEGLSIYMVCFVYITHQKFLFSPLKRSQNELLK